MYYSSGNILIGMEKDYHIPTLPASWNTSLFYRKAKASIVIPIIFFYLQSKIRLSSLQGERCLFLLYVKYEEQLHFDLICSDKIKMA